MHDLKIATNLDAVLAQRDALADKFAAIQKLMEETRSLMDACDFLSQQGRATGNRVLNLHGHWFTGESRGSSKGLSDEQFFAERSLKATDFHAWTYLFAIGYDKLLDSAGRENLARQLYEGDFLPLTQENAAATIQSLTEGLGDTVSAGVERMFLALNRDFKTNLPRMLGPKLVAEGVIHKVGGRWHSSRHTGDTINDLLHFMLLADDKPGDQRFTSWLDQKLRETTGLPRDIDHEYFRLRCFKNGNVHFAFTRMDLVEKLNRSIARRNPASIPAPAR